MRSFSLATVVASTALLAACPVESRQAELAHDTVLLAPTDDPGAVPEAARLFPLSAEPGAEIGVEAMTIPVGSMTQVSVHVRGGPPSSPLVPQIMTGSCADPGPLAADLEPVLTDAGGLGSSRSTIDIPAEQVGNGNHVILLTDRSADPRRLACGEIPGDAAATPPPTGDER